MADKVTFGAGLRHEYRDKAEQFLFLGAVPAPDEKRSQLDIGALATG
jgi:hypothetical protein